MYDKIGKKLMTLAKYICFSGIAASALAAIMIWVDDTKPEPDFLSGLVVLVTGSLASWVGSWLTYAVGQMTDDIHTIRAGSDLSVLLPMYHQAQELMEQGKYGQALRLLEEMPDFRNADALMQACHYQIGSAHFVDGEYAKAVEELRQAEDHPGSEEIRSEAIYQLAQELLKAGDKKGAVSLLDEISSYKDVRKIIASDDEMRQMSRDWYSSGSSGETERQE